MHSSLQGQAALLFVLAAVAVIVCARLYWRRRAVSSAQSVSRPPADPPSNLTGLGRWEHNLTTGELQWSPETLEIFGVDSPNFVPTQEDYFERVHPDDRTRVRDTLSLALTGDSRFQVGHRILLPDGSTRHLHASAEIRRDEAGNAVSIAGTIQDISDSLSRVESFGTNQERYHNLLESLPIPILVNRAGRIAYINQSGWELLGAPGAEAVVGKSMFEIAHPECHGALKERLRALCVDRRPAPRSDVKVIGLDGRVHEVEETVAAFYEHGTTCILTAWRDVTPRRRVETEIPLDAQHDTLTGLPNRTLFLDKLKLRFSLYLRGGETQFAVLVVDLDNFKLINLSLGHLVGDRILADAARRIHQVMNGADVLARLSGDAFGVLLQETSSVAEAQRVARTIQHALAEPFEADGHELFLTATVGIAPCGSHYREPGEILRDADTAMYRAKATGYGRQTVFDSRMYEDARARLHLVTELRQAIAANEFELYYQPLIELRTGSIAGFEALLRWRHPTRGLLKPVSFIPLAEEAGCITELDRWTLAEACRQCLIWNSRQGQGAPLTVSVNFSPRDFSSEDCASTVGRVLRETGLPGALLRIEITESALVENVDASIKTIEELQRLGVQVHLDDYGTGYSSLLHLSRLPVSHLKIDRSFIHAMGSSMRDAGIVQSTVALAHGLGMRAIAEGVETIEQLSQLRAFGCEEAQGYYFYPPLDVAKVEALLATPRPRPELLRRHKAV